MEKISKSSLEKKINNSNDFISNIFFIVICAVAIFFIYYLFNYAIAEIVVSGSSMEPTLYDGDILYLTRNVEPTYNDVIVIKGEKSGEWIIKRVIGLAGDEITIGEDGYVYRNGEKLEADYEKYGPTNVISWQNGRVLKDGEIFYLGDNRGNSADSRSSFSTCSEDQIVGVVSNLSIQMKGISNFLFYNVKLPIKNIFS